MYKRIDLSLYRADIHLFLNAKHSEYLKFVVKKASEYTFTDCTLEEYLSKFGFADEEDFIAQGGFAQRMSSHDYIICINEVDEDPAKLYNTICHEVAHIVAMVTLDRGLEHNAQTTEAIAYLSGWLFETIYNQLQLYREKEKKNKAKGSQKRSNKAS